MLKRKIKRKRAPIKRSFPSPVPSPTYADDLRQQRLTEALADLGRVLQRLIYAITDQINAHVERKTEHLAKANTDKAPTLINIKQVAELLHVSQRTAWRTVDDPDEAFPPTRRVGSKRFWWDNEVIAWINRTRNGRHAAAPRYRYVRRGRQHWEPRQPPGFVEP